MLKTERQAGRVTETNFSAERWKHLAKGEKGAETKTKEEQIAGGAVETRHQQSRVNLESAARLEQNNQSERRMIKEQWRTSGSKGRRRSKENERHQETDRIVRRTDGKRVRKETQT